MEVNVRGGRLPKGEEPTNTSGPQRDKERSRTNRVGMENTSRIKVLKKVQVVYYLTRNGLLEHPHYLEVSHLANHPLRLKDVTDRLSILRGKAMPSQYSWSCKRSYRNGYVWNDLTENDIIYPSQGSEYVLKGSELISAAHGQSSLLPYS
ncbi:suppressor of kinase [Ancistrocladus abbreviatus]